MKVVLAGNPNSGKSTLFNQLTGLRQKIGNFPGVTVERKSGSFLLKPGAEAEIIDLPGTYSIYPRSYDEQVVFDILTNPLDESYPDVVIVIVDSSNLKRNLLLFSQIFDLGIPVILALNMVDVAKNSGIETNYELLERQLQVKVVPMNARRGEGLEELKKALYNYYPKPTKPAPFYEPGPALRDILDDTAAITGNGLLYRNLLFLHHYTDSSGLTKEQKSALAGLIEQSQFNGTRQQVTETIQRYEKINQVTSSAVRQVKEDRQGAFTSRLDHILTHKIWGYAIFLGILFAMFQAIFSWATYPMDLIDGSIASLNLWLKHTLPHGVFSDLLTDGVVAGLGGVLVFIPQIAILFAFISILEETGYMARVMFLMDRIMRVFGLNGKSIVPLISGVACAVPAIMATRNIGNLKERLVTIFVTPLISCSARIPVYTILIALVIPSYEVLGFINMQGLVLMFMYLLGFVTALVSSWIISRILKTNEKSFFLLEMPDYRPPRFKNVWITITEKVKTFIFEAGKVIIAISMVLWLMAAYGPGKAVQQAEEKAKKEAVDSFMGLRETEQHIASARLKASYAGHFGKWIEPVILPLGFDWKIGIALITSFAAREVFVGTISTIYSIGTDDAESDTVREKLAAQTDPATGKPFFNLARGMSIMIFYAFALQCMSTIAVVRKETGNWKFALLQLLYLTALAYFASLVTYQVLS